ncbi:uncharacterized protein PG986_014344 [Apiospora aurea]|uniref:Clr5 domain-containing protein n=1 Tax=Apiospora aurea TaxID=335848 RepID=A0ABR1PSQ4_9PEZI
MFPTDSQSIYRQDDDWLSSQLPDSQMQDYFDSQSPAPDSLSVIQTQTSDRSSQSATPSQQESLTFAPANGNGDTSNRRSRSNHIRYDVEWKITLNRRSKAEGTEQDVRLAPREFWESSLRRKLEKVAEKKFPANRSFQVEDTKMIVSVTGKRKLKKRYDGLNIDWAVLAKQLRSWSHLLARRKQLCINIVFNYVETTPAPRLSQRQTRRSTTPRTGSATDLMLQELDGHVDSSGEPLPWRHVRSLMMPGASLPLGSHARFSSKGSGPTLGMGSANPLISTILYFTAAHFNIHLEKLTHPSPEASTVLANLVTAQYDDPFQGDRWFMSAQLHQTLMDLLPLQEPALLLLFGPHYSHIRIQLEAYQFSIDGINLLLQSLHLSLVVRIAK